MSDIKIDDIKKMIKDAKVNMLEMFAYQGPPSKNWLKTQGRFWEGWNAALDKILESIEKQKERAKYE